MIKTYKIMLLPNNQQKTKRVQYADAARFAYNWALERQIENFKDGFDFDKDADCVTKRLPTYLSDMPITVWTDGYISRYKWGINLRRNGYLLTMTDEYKELINYLDMGIENLPEQFIVSLRGRFK